MCIFLFLWSLLSSILKKKVQDLCNCNACCDFSRLMASWISLNYFGQSRLKQVTKQRTIPPPPPLTPTPSYNTIHNLTHHREANTFSTIWQIIRRCFYQMFLSKLIFARFIALNISKLALCMSQVTLLLPFLQVMQFLKQKTQQGILLVVQIEMFPKDQ